MQENSTLNKTLYWAVLAGIFILPFIPLVVTKGMFFPFVTGNNFFFRINYANNKAKDKEKAIAHLYMIN